MGLNHTHGHTAFSLQGIEQLSEENLEEFCEENGSERTFRENRRTLRGGVTRTLDSRLGNWDQMPQLAC